MFGLIAHAAKGLMKGPAGAVGAAAGGFAKKLGGGSPAMAAAGLARRMSSTAPSTGLGAAPTDAKPPADTSDIATPRTFLPGANRAMGQEYRGQASSLRSATRRQQRRAGRALSR